MIELLRTRRSIRAFTDQKVEGEKLETLKEAALRSPSSRSINPWRFVFVDDKALIKELATSKKHGSTFMSGASLAIVVCGDEGKSDVWIEDCSIASLILHVTAHSLGLGSCWVQIRNRNRTDGKCSESFVRELLGIPSDVRIEAIIAVGYPAEQKDPVSRNSLDDYKVMTNRYDAEQAASGDEKRLCKPK